MDRYIVIDLETTGHSPTSGDKIIDVGIILIENNAIIKEYSTLLNPNKSIPPFISNLTGIVDTDVETAPQFEEKADEIVAMVEEGYIVAHNIPFDLGFLNEELSKIGFRKLNNPVLDTVELARILFPQAPGFQLGQLAEYFEINHEYPHRALSDANVTAKLFLLLKQKLESLPYETIVQLLKLEKSLQSNLYELLHRREQKLAFSLEVREDIDTYQGLAFKKKEDVPIHKAFLLPTYGEFLDSIYEQNGTMEIQLNNYEKRCGQREMSEHIFDVFQTKKHALIEAGTGTGKTIAYLVPAIYEAISTEKRIVISTYTTQLQAQIIDEEIPLIRKLLSFPFQVALLKGKNHYISLERFERELNNNQEDNYDIALTKAMLLVWITETDTGDIEEIQLPSSGYFFYKGISTAAEESINPASPWFHLSFYQRARHKAQQADIIITNHALLCTDMINAFQFLPTYEKVIVDEAHHLETIASQRYGQKLDYVNMQYTLNKIGSTIDGTWLTKILKQYPLGLEEFSTKAWDSQIQQTKHEVDDLFRTLFQYVINQKQNKSLSDIGRIQYRFDESKEKQKHWTLIKDMADRVILYLTKLNETLTSLERVLDKKADLDDMKDIMNSFHSFIDRLKQLLLEENALETKWIEIEAQGAKNAVYLYSEPTDVSTLLKDDLFNVKESVILTSATLTMRNSFSFMQNRLGIPSERLFTKQIDSPFSFQDQVQLMIPNDFPDVNHGNLDDYIYSTCEAILSLAHITNGRMLVLFTSYDMLKRSYLLLKEIMDLNEYVLIAQGISSGSRTRLKKNFQTFEKSILLGTSSFWEGVDIPGEDLSCLVIARLPFDPPGHPIQEAKAVYLKKEGKNAFYDFSLPNAVIRFKQGFGRLIRSTRDRGIVFVCDARVMKSRYGHYFTESIPEVPITYDSTSNLMRKAEEWF